MEERLYLILGGMLFDFHCLNVYMSRRQYPINLLSNNRTVVYLVKIIKNVHEADSVCLTFSRLKDWICKIHNIDPKNLSTDPKADRYFIIYDKAREIYEKYKDDFQSRWRKELKWAVEEYIRRRRLWLSEKEHLMAKNICLGMYKKEKKCRACPVRKQCLEASKLNKRNIEYMSIWREEEEEKLRVLLSDDNRVKIFSYNENIEDRRRYYQNVFDLKTDKPEATLGIPFSIPTLRRWTDGWCKGRAACIAGRTGKGKTALVLQEELYAFLHSNVNILHFNLEMPHFELEARLDSALTGIHFGNIIKGTYESEEEFQKFSDLLKNSQRKNEFKIIDVPNLSIGEFRYYVRKFYNRWGDNFIVVLDNLNIMEYPARMRQDEAASHVAKVFHDTIKEYNISGIILAQLNRDADGETRITPRHFRDSDKIPDHMDWVVAIVDWGKSKKRLVLVKGRSFIGDYITLENNLHIMKLIEVQKEVEEMDEDEECFYIGEEHEETVCDMSEVL